MRHTHTCCCGGIAGSLTLQFTSSATPGKFTKGFTANITARCAAGWYSPGLFAATSPSKSTCLPCPAGTYSSTPGAFKCLACPKFAPYSPAGSVLKAACVACTTGCEDGTYGAVFTPCPGDKWLGWLDVEGVEGTHSCLRALPNVGNWVAANATCLASSLQLLTVKQVRRWARVCVRCDTVCATLSV